MRSFNEQFYLKRAERLIEELKQEEPELISEILPAIAMASGAVRALPGVVSKGVQQLGKTVATGIQSARRMMRNGSKTMGGGSDGVPGSAANPIDDMHKLMQKPKIKQLVDTFNNLNPQDIKDLEGANATVAGGLTGTNSGVTAVGGTPGPV